MLATVASAGLMVGGVTVASAATASPADSTAEAATTYCPFRARNDTWVRSSPGGTPVYVWKKGVLKFLPTNGPISGQWRWIATSRWAYIPAIYRDTSIACYHD